MQTTPPLWCQTWKSNFLQVFLRFSEETRPFPGSSILSFLHRCPSLHALCPLPWVLWVIRETQHCRDPHVNSFLFAALGPRCHRTRGGPDPASEGTASCTPWVLCVGGHILQTRTNLVQFLQLQPTQHRSKCGDADLHSLPRGTK